MPIHDWTRVGDAVCRDFHQTWCLRMKERLNGGLLPPDCYAILEFTIPTPVDGFNGPTIGARLRNEETEEPIVLQTSLAPVSNAVGRNAVVIRTAEGDKVVEVIRLPFRPEEPLPDMPVFLRPGECVMLPLEETYAAAYQVVPLRWRKVIEAG